MGEKVNCLTGKNSDFIVEVIRDNEEFLREKAKKTFDEIIELINDAIDHMIFIAGRREGKEDYVENSMSFFIYHVLLPQSYAIYTDLLTGNLPVCFMELRLMLEMLTKCYLADLKYPDETFFIEKIKLLEKENKSTSKSMKELEKRLDLENNIVTLWGKLSTEWIHAKGIADKFVDQIIRAPGIPSWGLITPMNYTENDLENINEVYKRVSQYRIVLKTLIGKYFNIK